MNMDTDALRWFQQVADGVTVTEVAELFMVSQPGVSRALARLEQQAGTPLLYRSGRILRPTRAGSVLKRHVDAVLHALDDGLAAVAELLDPGTGTVSLAFQQSFGRRLVPELISGFRQWHPDVSFVLEPSYDALGSSLVASGRTDLEVTARAPHNPDVRWEPLFSQPLSLALPPGHRLGGRSGASLAEVADDDFVMLRPPWELRRLCDDLCTAAGFEPRVAFEGDLTSRDGFHRAHRVALDTGDLYQPANWIASHAEVVLHGDFSGHHHLAVGTAQTFGERPCRHG